MRNVIVTGGSRGLGLAIVRKLAASGYRVISVARAVPPTKREDGDEQELQQDSLHCVPFDLREIGKLGELVGQIHKDFGPIHGLVNNAALGTDGALAMMPNSGIDDLVRLNISSPIVLTKYVVRRMMADGGGRIVNISSIAAFSGYTGLSVYAATKSAMVGFTRSLAREVGRYNVNVNAIAPGFLETDMTRALDEKRRSQLIRRSALGRFTRLKDVADATEFLLGDASDSITGTVLTVDAGTTA